MLATRDAQEVLNSEFLQIRCTILDLAAALDRLDRAPDHPGQHPDPRRCQINQALEALMIHDMGRAETVQRIFSLEYDPEWQTKFGQVRPRS